MEENRELDIDLRKIFAMLKKKAIFIILIALIGAVAAGCITNFFIEPQYTATIKLYAYSSTSNRLGTESSISSNDIDASEKLVNTYLEVVDSNTFLKKVSDTLGNKVSAGEIKKMMSASQITDTFAFKVRITSENANLSKEIANTIAEICPDEIVRQLKVGGVSVIDYAELPTKPSSPNIEKNILFGFLAGLIASFAVFFIKELFDTSINDESDLAREFDVPVLGTIPRLTPVSDKVKTPTGNDISSISNRPSVDISEIITNTGDNK